MHTKKIISGVCLLLSGLPLPAYAQDNSEVMQRMDKLEHDLMVLQRQEARNGGKSEDTESDSTDTAPPAAGNAGSTEVQMSNMEDELRKLRGSIEENQFQTKQLFDRFNKFQQDTEFRLNAMEAANAKAAAEVKPVPPAPVQAPQNPPQHPPAVKNEPLPQVDTSSEARPGNEGEAQPEETTAGNGSLELPSDEKNGETFDTPRDQYNYAFRLLNQTRYEDAAHYFKDFTEKYPHDPLVGNAYYWLGETYYIRHDYVKAGDSFRQGFEALPGGPKAADNLLKLSMSLGAMNKTKDACVVLDQLLVKFKETSPSVAQKAGAERTRLGCK